MLPLGLQLYSVREQMEKDFAGTLAKVKAMGYEAVEFAGLFGRDAEDVRTLLDRIGLIPVSAHVPYVEMRQDIGAVIETYKRIGCDYLVVPYLAEEDRLHGSRGDEVIHHIVALGQIVARAGLKLLYHNHDFEFKKIGDEYALDRLYRMVPEECLETELDSCWIKVGGEDPVDYLHKYSGRAPVVHLKDFYQHGSAEGAYELIGQASKATAKETDFQFRPLGDGMQDIPAIIAAAEKAKAKWLIVEQDRPSLGLSELESAERSINYLRSL